jgi:hypothetical protein
MSYTKSYAISPEVQALVKSLATEKGLYQKQVIEASVKLYADLSKSHKEKGAQ